jgi:hypothetical protein
VRSGPARPANIEVQHRGPDLPGIFRSINTLQSSSGLSRARQQSKSDQIGSSLDIDSNIAA